MVAASLERKESALTSERLRSRVVVDSCIRSAEISGYPAAVLRRGDPDAGSVFIKVYSRSGCAYLYGQSLTDDGRWNWRNLLPENSLTEVAADERIAKEFKIDRDIWVVEVLDDALENPLFKQREDVE